ncbi:hypothetical protein C8R43DRAFT_964758 [Mycena crocata]|nr:hypothetical protein C8R43DRAFT_964758 [Mycena crocata]
MPLQVTVAQARLNRAITGLTGAVQTLEVFAYSFKTPFLQPISTTARSLLSGLMNVKKNREDCSKLMEQTYRLLYGIISLHISSETEAELLPSQLNNLGKFTDFVEAQQDKIRIKDFFRQGEMATLLKECNAGLQQGLDAFKRYAEERHKEAVQLVENLFDPSFSDTGSSRFFVFGNSSTSISILPPEPKIFHGRQSEISEILSLFTQETVAIAILGPGGMGKTSLAKAILHHPDITGRLGSIWDSRQAQISPR